MMTNEYRRSRHGTLTININDLQQILTSAIGSDNINVEVDSIEKNDELIPFIIGDKILIHLNLKYLK